MKTGGKISLVRNRSILKIVWDEFVYGSHLVAVGDILSLFVISVILDIKVSISFFLVVYFSILAINFFNRYKEQDLDALTNPERLDSVSKYFRFTPHIVAVLFFVSVCLTAINAPISALIFMLFLFGLGLLYTILLKDITKKIVGFKNIMTALPYALLVIFMSLFYGAPITLATVLVTIFYFLRMFINTMFFDIKDIKSDKKEGLKTFPVVFGATNTKLFLVFINIISMIPILIGIASGILPFYSVVLYATIIYAFLYLNNRQLFRKQSTLYNVVVDGEFILWLPYLVIGKILL